jgi:2-polyprenyl-6-hydroxyphenyl methylase/3-demethylubiquinone-9 3-methyltransferase
VKDFLKTGNPFKSWRHYALNNRGMSAYYDLVDWVGGYPFEVAKPEEVFGFFKAKGFTLLFLKTCGGGLGCNEYIFQRK